MANIFWYWEEGEENFRELIIDFTIHNDPGSRSDKNNSGNWPDKHGLYLMLCNSTISDTMFYFGLQTDAGRGERGKRIIYSRWETRDLANARTADPTEGWTESSGHEGDFIGVRRSYGWTSGDYRARIAPDGAPDADGEWYGVWITELSSGITTWGGSLKFPFVDGRTVIESPTYTTLEIYGNVIIRPIDIPEWHVSLKMPMGGGARPNAGYIDYSPFTEGGVKNSEVSVVPEEGAVHFYVGGTTERETPEGWSTW